MILFQNFFRGCAQGSCGIPFVEGGVITRSSDINSLKTKAQGALTVSYAEKVDDELIMSRIRKAGYTVTEIK